MIGTVHLLFGAAIGKFVGDPFLTIILAFVTHYLIDWIPHCQAKAVKGYREHGLLGCDKKDLALKSIEPVLGLILLFYLVSKHDGSAGIMLLGAFFGLLPDLLTFVEWKYGKRARPPYIADFERKFHRHIGVIGIIPQILVMILCLLYLL